MQRRSPGGGGSRSADSWSVWLEAAINERESGGVPDESAIREMTILIAVELGLKLLEASIPGGVTLAKRLAEDAARAAIDRLEFVEAGIRRQSGL